MNQRQMKILSLQRYYITNFVEDPQDGTPFDIDVLNALDMLRDKYKDAEVKEDN